MTGETPVTISAPGQISVIIFCTKLDHSVDKPFEHIPFARSLNAMDNEVAPITFNVDVGMVNESIQIQGFLADETTESAMTKKTNLIKIAYYERTVTISWGTGSRAQTYSGNINKCMITETPGIVGEQQSGYESEKNFAVQLSLIVGTDYNGD